MGMSTSGILAYGYDIGGGPETGWKLKGLDKYGDPVGETPEFLNWFNKLGIYDFGYNAEKILVSSVTDFDETFSDGKPDYYKRHKAALEEYNLKLGVKVIAYGSSDYPSYIIATSAFIADDWGSAVVKPHLDHSAFERLDCALKILHNCQPKQEQPEWILASYYG